MAICIGCGGRRIPVPGLGKLHPNCYPESAVLWPVAEMQAWVAARDARITAALAAEAVVSAPGGGIR
jgi:hypothetical protein